MKTEEIKKIPKIYTDGSCASRKGGQGGGWAFYHINDQGEEIYYAGHTKEITTNNRMEITGVLRAMQYFSRYYPHVPIKILSDSQYVVNAFNDWLEGWERKNWALASGGRVKNQHLWAQTLDLKRRHPWVMVEWVKGHNNNMGNERADALCYHARLSQQDYYLDNVRGPLRSCENPLNFHELPSRNTYRKSKLRTKGKALVSKKEKKDPKLREKKYPSRKERYRRYAKQQAEEQRPPRVKRNGEEIQRFIPCDESSQIYSWHRTNMRSCIKPGAGKRERIKTRKRRKRF